MNKVIFLLVFSILLLVPVGALDAFAGTPPHQIVSARVRTFDVIGEGPLPIGTNFAPVESRVTIDVSELTPSPGISDYQFPGIPTDVVDGQSFVVGSEFDVFFEISIQDIDPDDDFHGLSVDKFERVLTVRTTGVCVADTTKPNFGCLGQDKTIGVPQIQIPLNVDIDGDGMFDKVFFDSIITDLNLDGFEFIDEGEVAGQWDMDHDLGGNVNPPFTISMGGTIIISEQIFFNPSVIGGEIIPIETTSLLLASTQSFSWMIPVLLSGIGIGLFVFRKSENP